MGQQQLLLLILGILIVGIAIVVGINAYSENSVKANWDSLLQESMRIANDAQQWKAKPFLFGGSVDETKSSPADFSGATFYTLGFSSERVGNNGECYQSLNGVYSIVADAAGMTITASNASNRNQVVVLVSGNMSSDVDLVEESSIRGGTNVITGAAATIDPATCTIPESGGPGGGAAGPN